MWITIISLLISRAGTFMHQLLTTMAIIPVVNTDGPNSTIDVT
jgi:hypothetical protein